MWEQKGTVFQVYLAISVASDDANLKDTKYLLFS